MACLALRINEPFSRYCYPNPGSKTAPPWVGSRSPDGWDQIPCQPGGWVLHQPPWSFGFDSQTRGTRKTGAPCDKVPGSLSAWWLGLAPATLEFWVRFPNERNQGKQARPVLKYRVPHGSHFGCGSGFGIGFTLLFTRSSPSRHPPFTQYPSPSRSLVRDGQTSPHKPRLVVPHSTCPSLSPSPPAHSFIIGPAVINTHTRKFGPTVFFITFGSGN